MKLELVSFALCPYVQRSVITLKIKKAPFATTYIDLETPPAWFEEISPLGQVPLLKVDEKTVLFESAVINEFIDETVGRRLHPEEPVRRALERSWIEYGSELLRSAYLLSRESDAKAAASLRAEFFTDLSRVETVVSTGPYFRGKDFGLVDAAYAPLFMRIFLLDTLRDDPAWKSIPKTHAWAESLLRLPEVRESVQPDFGHKYLEYLRKARSALVSRAA